MSSSNAVDEMMWAASIIQQRNGVNVGFIESGIDLRNQDSPFAQIGAVRYIDGQPIYSFLSASVSADGTCYSHAPTPPNDATGNVIATVDWVKQNSLPTGSCIVWSSSTPPSGFLKNDGSAVSRTTYSKLFAAVGTTYGEGDGSTTFNLPTQTRYLANYGGDEMLWFKLYSDGWLEQGGNTTPGQYQVTLMREYRNVYYTAVVACLAAYSANSYAIINRTTTTFQINRGTSATDIGASSFFTAGYASSVFAPKIECIKY